MVKLRQLMDKDRKLVIGLMSGTSVDGIDAALIELCGHGKDTTAKLLHFINSPFSPSMRQRIMQLFNGGSSAELCHMNFLLGHLFADAALALCRSNHISPDEIDLIGSHGQTIYHIPEPIEDTGYQIRSTLQIGEPAIIAAKTGAVTVGNFRVADMALMGNGAPLVPYSEYLLYADNTRTVALQNIGGIGNITVLPKGCDINQIMAFDTGPGNMVIDAAMELLTNGRQTYDDGGQLGLSGQVYLPLLQQFLQDTYFAKKPPKTTGREYFGAQYTKQFVAAAQNLGLSAADIIATATAITSHSIAQAIEQLVPAVHRPQRLIVGGGGSYNACLLAQLRTLLPQVEVLTNEDLGLSSDAKEAVAFAVLANEAIHTGCSNVPAATGALRATVLGCIYQ